MSESTEDKLRSAMLVLGKDLLVMSKDSFRNWASSLDAETAELLLEKHRSNRDFYRAVLTEERKKEFPQAFRYVDAEKKLEKYNQQGKILKEVVESNKS